MILPLSWELSKYEPPPIALLAFDWHPLQLYLSCFSPSLLKLDSQPEHTKQVVNAAVKQPVVSNLFQTPVEKLLEASRRLDVLSVTDLFGPVLAAQFGPVTTKK